MKSVEVFLIEELGLKNPNMIHFGLTSEDVNNLSYTLLLKEYLENEQLPQLEKLINELLKKTEKWKSNIFFRQEHTDRWLHQQLPEKY